MQRWMVLLSLLCMLASERAEARIGIVPAGADSTAIRSEDMALVGISLFITGSGLFLVHLAMEDQARDTARQLNYLGADVDAGSLYSRGLKIPSLLLIGAGIAAVVSSKISGDRGHAAAGPETSGVGSTRAGWHASLSPLGVGGIRFGVARSF